VAAYFPLGCRPSQKVNGVSIVQTGKGDGQSVKQEYIFMGKSITSPTQLVEEKSAGKGLAESRANTNRLVPNFRENGGGFVTVQFEQLRLLLLYLPLPSCWTPLPPSLTT